MDETAQPEQAAEVQATQNSVPSLEPTEPVVAAEPPLSQLIEEIEKEEEEEKEKRAKLHQKVYLKRPVGRPRIITKPVVAILRSGFLMGYSDKEACIYAGISTDALYDYENKYPEFSDYKQAWKENPILKAKATLYNSLNEKGMASWYLERKLKDEFAVRNELTGPKGAAIPVTINYVVPAISKPIESAGDPVQTPPETTPGVGTPE